MNTVVNPEIKLPFGDDYLTFLIYDYFGDGLVLVSPSYIISSPKIEHPPRMTIDLGVFNFRV